MKISKRKIPWNKGKKYARYKEPACKRFRRNENYRLSELKTNANRNKGINMNVERRRTIKEWWHKILEETGGIRGRKMWSKKEISYLKENYKSLSVKEMCLTLDRSFSSVSHKLSRLKLIYYNKWN